MSDELNAAELYGQYQAPLRRYAAGLTGDSGRADDLVQDTFIQAMAHLDLLSGLNPHQRRAWLYRVLKNRFIDQQRAGKRQMDLLRGLALDELSARTTFPTPDAYRLDLMEDMPEHYRAVIRRHYWLGMTSEEIGRELNLPPATVRSRLRLSLKWLRNRTNQPD